MLRALAVARCETRVREHGSVPIALLALGLVCSLPVNASSQRPGDRREPYGLKYELRPGLQIVTFHTQQGRVRVTLPERLGVGQQMSGTVESLAEGASTAPSSYTVELAGQRVVVKDRALRFTAPAEAGLAPLVLRDFRENEVARFDLTISPTKSGSSISATAWKGDRFWVPDLIEAAAPVPLLGPFDGNSATTKFDLNGVPCEILTETAGRATARCVNDRGGPLPAGPARYELLKGETKTGGEARVVAVQTSGIPTELANGKHTTMRVALSGLAGLARDVEFKIEVLTPTIVILERDAPINYFPHYVEFCFVHPKDVKRDGTYVTQRLLMGIQHGDPIEIAVNLVIPTTPHEVVEQVLRTPRTNFSKNPGEEHAEALAFFGDQAFPLVSEFLTDGELAWEAEYLLFHDKAKAAPLVIPVMPEMDGQPLSIALGAYLYLAQHDPAFPYKRELHEVSRSVLKKGKWSMDAIFVLGTLGTDADMPLLESIYQGQKTRMAPATPFDLVMNAAEASLARLGSAEHIRNIKERLSIVVKTPADAENFSRAANDAQFAGSEEFVPALCQHLTDRSWWFGDYGYAPASSAAGAINEIARANKKTPSEVMAACPKQ